MSDDIIEVGDKVEIIHTSYYGWNDLEAGCVRTVSEVGSNCFGSKWYGIYSTCSPYPEETWCFYPNEVRLVSKGEK